MILKAKNLAYMEKKTAYGTISLMGSKNNRKMRDFQYMKLRKICLCISYILIVDLTT